MKKLPAYLLVFCLTLPIHARLAKAPSAENLNAAIALNHKKKSKFLEKEKKPQPYPEQNYGLYTF
ncbi:hypothetical protein I5M27_15030 [Adhaeribacter sp. BT258]|uniref:Uncharacterized protein n=1 Tax=Adhaeribacter terrigena TaxID=2793070 RepID=A0ABS1C4M6_9BACT|nr:hypothetical protein [Adhaeribacter terrigena]MBK0404309.1 hypothetical protein [Adhaeribacter terrigena]